MLKTVIIDDEPNAILSIELIIKEYCSDIKIVGKAHSAIEGKTQIIEKEPDFIFLDIDMPRGSGFDMLEMIPEINFDIIFVTAYSDYAIKAFKYSAVDYILKPMEIDEIINSINKVKKRKELNLFNNFNLDVLMSNMNNNKIKTLAIANTSGIDYVSIDKIIRFKAEGSYTKIIINGQGDIFASRNLKEYQELLPEKDFFRPHNSHLINLSHVNRYVQKDGGYIEMSDKSIVPISRRKKDIFIEKMNTFINN